MYSEDGKIIQIELLKASHLQKAHKNKFRLEFNKKLKILKKKFILKAQITKANFLKWNKILLSLT